MTKVCNQHKNVYNITKVVLNFFSKTSHVFFWGFDLLVKKFCPCEALSSASEIWRILSTESMSYKWGFSIYENVKYLSDLPNAKHAKRADFLLTSTRMGQNLQDMYSSNSHLFQLVKNLVTYLLWKNLRISLITNKADLAEMLIKKNSNSPRRKSQSIVSVKNSSTTHVSLGETYFSNFHKSFVSM